MKHNGDHLSNRFQKGCSTKRNQKYLQSQSHSSKEDLRRHTGLQQWEFKTRKRILFLGVAIVSQHCLKSILSIQFVGKQLIKTVHALSTH